MRNGNFLRAGVGRSSIAPVAWGRISPSLRRWRFCLLQHRAGLLRRARYGQHPRQRVQRLFELVVIRFAQRSFAGRGPARGPVLADRVGRPWRTNNKDAADLHRLLTTYADAGNFDRLYDQESALLEAVEFDLELAGAELLGRDVARICPAPTLEQARALLTFAFANDLVSRIKVESIRDQLERLLVDRNL